MTSSVEPYIPPISFLIALLQIGVYLFRELLQVHKEEDVYASWKTIIIDGELWRLVSAQFFHFGRAHIFFSVVTLMTLGRHLEKKIKAEAFGLIVLLMSIISNLFFIFLNDFICPDTSGYVVGFSTTLVALRVIYIFTMDRTADNGQQDPNLIFGFIPIYLPNFITPWQPLLETVIFEVLIVDNCVAANFSGMLAALYFPFLIKHYRNHIMILPNPPQ